MHSFETTPKEKKTRRKIGKWETATTQHGQKTRHWPKEMLQKGQKYGKQCSSIQKFFSYHSKVFSTAIPKTSKQHSKLLEKNKQSSPEQKIKTMITIGTRRIHKPKKIK